MSRRRPPATAARVHYRGRPRRLRPGAAPWRAGGLTAPSETVDVVSSALDGARSIRIGRRSSPPRLPFSLRTGESLVQEAAVSLLLAWQNFYVIVGSSAGALTGLTFVVIILGAGARYQSGSGGLQHADGRPFRRCAPRLCDGTRWRVVANIGRQVHDWRIAVTGHCSHRFTMWLRHDDTDAYLTVDEKGGADIVGQCLYHARTAPLDG